MDTIEEKVLTDISKLHMQRLIIDVSGMKNMDVDVIDRFYKVIDGIHMMGCKVVITGMRPELVRKMVTLGIHFNQKAAITGTLQQALKEYLL